MPSEEVAVAYQDARLRHEAATRELVSALERMTVETLADVLPRADLIEVVGEFDEDWIPTLRIQRVLDAGGGVLFDVKTGHPDRAVEDAVDAANTEYLDVLIDLTGDEYMGLATIGLALRVPGVRVRLRRFRQLQSQVQAGRRHERAAESTMIGAITCISWNNPIDYAHVV